MNTSILKPNPRKALQRCWCPAETHHDTFHGTSQPKEWEWPLLLNPRGTYVEGCDYTNSFSMDSTHRPGTNGGEISCLAPYRGYLAFSFPPLWSGFFGVYNLFQQSNHCPSSSIIIPPSSEIAHTCYRSEIPFLHLLGKTILSPLLFHLLASLQHRCQAGPDAFTLSSLTFAASMAWGTATQPQQTPTRCAMRSHISVRAFGIRMCICLPHFLASNYCHS